MVCKRDTVIGISGADFSINNNITYTKESGFPNASKWVKGRLLMLKSANGIFDDENYPEWGSDKNPYFGTVSWDYPNGKWDPFRNTKEFVEQLSTYRKHGLLLININLMGNQPTGRAGSHPWVNSAFTPRGDLKSSYMERLSLILDEADRLGMVVMVGLFYPRMDRLVFVQDFVNKDDALIRKCITNAMEFLVSSGHRNILVEIGNESNNRFYEHWMLRGDRVFEAIEIAREACEGIFPVSTSVFKVSDLSEEAFKVMDFILLHNFVGNPNRVKEEVTEVKKYVPNKPIIMKEDTNVFSMASALESGASFGLYHQGVNDYREGFQSIPINWRINTVGKWNFFYQIARLTGSPLPEKPNDLPDVPETKVLGINNGDKFNKENLKDILIEVKTPKFFSSSLTLPLHHVEFFIDGVPVKYSGTYTNIHTGSDMYTLEDIKPDAYTLSGKDLMDGPLEFNIINLSRGKHTLSVIPYYLDECIPIGVHKAAFRERIGQSVEINFEIL